LAESLVRGHDSLIDNATPKDSKMTDKQIVVRTAQAKGFDLIKPTKADKTILVMAPINGFYKCLVEAANWAEARAKLAKINGA
jgi:hypothetical protein